MIKSSHRSEIQESSVALREMKYDPRVERSFVKMGAVYPRAIEVVQYPAKCGSLSSCDRGLVHDLSFPTVVRYRSYRFCARCYCRCEIISITCVRNYRSLSQDGSLPSCQRGRETLRLPGSVWGIVLSLNVRSGSGSGSGSAPTNQPHHLAPPSLRKAYWCSK